MSSPETLVKATLNRLAARISQKIINSAAKLAVIANEAPEKIQKEWELFQTEGTKEADRLEKESTTESSDMNNNSNFSDIKNPLEKIDNIRAKMAEINKKLEAKG